MPAVHRHQERAPICSDGWTNLDMVILFFIAILMTVYRDPILRFFIRCAIALTRYLVQAFKKEQAHLGSAKDDIELD